jgi:hypothetical protein
MWSHYGANHQGIAFEFYSLGAFFGMAFRVNYAKEATPIDPEATDGEDLFVHGLLTKALPWQPEDEYRLIATDENEQGFIHTNAGVGSFPPDELTAIYVGCNMPHACIRAVVNEAANRDKPVPVRQMVKVPRGAFSSKICGGIASGKTHLHAFCFFPLPHPFPARRGIAPSSVQRTNSRARIARAVMVA